MTEHTPEPVTLVQPCICRTIWLETTRQHGVQLCDLHASAPRLKAENERLRGLLALVTDEMGGCYCETIDQRSVCGYCQAEAALSGKEQE